MSRHTSMRSEGQGRSVGRGGSDFKYTAIALRSLSGNIAVFVTTSAIDEPTRP